MYDATEFADQTFKYTANVTGHPNDPYSVCCAYDFDVKHIFMPDSTLGLSVRSNRCATIFLNNSLDDVHELLVLFHEIGHCRMHKDESTPFMRSIMLGGWIPQIEREANEFAVRYMVDILRDQDIELPTSYAVLQYFGLPESFARFVE